MSLSDPLLMLADIARLSLENADLDEALVRAIYQHQVITTGRQPTLPEAREYIGHLTSHLDDVTIRVTLGLAPPARGTPAARSRARVVRARRPGRPGWTRDLFWARYREALDRAAPSRTAASIAAHFEMLDGELGTEARYLRKLIKRHGLPPA